MGHKIVRKVVHKEVNVRVEVSFLDSIDVWEKFEKINSIEFSP